MDGSDPPFFVPGAGAGVLRNSHLRSTPWGGRSRPNYPWREGQDEERGPGGPVPPDPPVAPEPLAAHIAASEPDARSGWASPPEPPGCEETHTHQRSLQRGTGLRLDDLTPLWKIKDFPQGASFCLQFSLATDLPSPQPHPCHLLSPLDRQNRGSLATTARTPSLTFANPFQPHTGQLAGLFFHELTRIPEAVSRDLSAEGQIRADREADGRRGGNPARGTHSDGTRQTKAPGSAPEG